MAVTTFKPATLSLSGLVAPEWRWARKRLCIFVPFWEIGGSPTELIGRKQGITAGTTVWSYDTKGPVYDFQGSYPRMYFPDCGSYRLPTTEVTVYIRYKWRGTGTGWTSLIRKVYNEGSSPWFSYGIQQNGSLNSGVLQGVIGYSGDQTSTANASAALPTNRFVNVFLRWKSGEKVKLDILEDDGSSFATALSASTLTATIIYTTGELRITGDGSASAIDGIASVAMGFAEQFTDEQIKKLAIDPFAPFRPRWMPYSVAVVAGILRQMMAHHGG